MAVTSLQINSHITHTHTHTTGLWLSEFCPEQRRWYQKKHSPTVICFLHLLQSMASSLFNLRAWWSFSTISVEFFFGLPLCLAPSTSSSIHFFTQSLSSFYSTCPYYCNLFCCRLVPSPRLCHLILVSLLTIYLELFCSLYNSSVY